MNYGATAVGVVWIRDDSVNLQPRLFIIAHTGSSGHRESTTTTFVLCKLFFWTTLSTDVETFIRFCIQCLLTTGRGKVPRSFGLAVYGTSANDLLQFDSIEIAPSVTANKYVLILREEHSDCMWFLTCANALAENLARAIVDWCAAFLVLNSLISDGITSFKSETIRLVAKGLKATHHLTLSYTP